MSRSVWLDLDDVTAKLDVKRLEELFPNKTSASKKKAKVEVKETKSLLDNNRAKNLGIVYMHSVCVFVCVRVHVCVCVCTSVCVCACYLHIVCEHILMSDWFALDFCCICHQVSSCAAFLSHWMRLRRILMQLMVVVHLN